MISNETLLNDSVISLPPKTVVGYRENGMPIYNIAGGSGDVTVEASVQDEETDVEDSDDDGDDSEEESDSWVPPTREDWEKLMSAKTKADSEAAARKRYLRDAGLDPKTGKPIEKPKLDIDLEEDGETVAQEETPKKDSGFSKEKLEKLFERNLEREVAKTEQRVRSQIVPLISAVPTALDDAGWNGKNLPRMLKLLDLDSVQVDSDGDIEGLTEQVEELKKDFPEFFKRTRMREAVKDVADSKTVGGGKKKAPASEEDQDWKTRLKAQLYGE